MDQAALFSQVCDVWAPMYRQITVDIRPQLTEALGPAWGYHLVDINLALGNLIADVRGEETAYRAQH
jgi:hypothetical protein